MGALRRIVTRLLTIKTMDARLTSFRARWGDRYQLSLVLLLWAWWVDPYVAWPSTVVVGWSPSILAYILRPMLMLPGLPLVVSCELSVGVGVVMVVAVIVTTIVFILIIVIVATVIIVPSIVVAAAIVIPPMIVLITLIVVVAPVVFIMIVIIVPVAVVLPVPLAGSWPISFLVR